MRTDRGVRRKKKRLRAGAKKMKKGGGRSKQQESLLEQEFIHEVVHLASKNKSEIARKAWPELKAPVRKLQHLEQRQGKKKPQRVTLEDAFRLARALNKDFGGLVVTAISRMEQRIERDRSERNGSSPS
ncbi:MAG: hypothetical protein PHY29_11505 [Syntrophales bacterium]|nr:hypothetical protein [Syntrophales bacterium]